jgi:hypothetical protein
MNASMQHQTRQILIRFCCILGLFALFSAGLVASIHYRKMLATTTASQDIIVHNMTKMQTTAREVEKIVTGFRRLLPPGYGSLSAERLLYTRLDELRVSLKPAEMTLKAIENRAGALSIEFTASFPLRRASDYATIINQLGRQETLAFPFISIESIIIGQDSAAAAGGLKIQVEGTVQTPAPQLETAS